MKLGSLKEGGRDGTLVVVSKDLSKAARVSDIAQTFQQAIENWTDVEPKLRSAYDALNNGTQAGAFDLNVADMASPFPRAYQFLDGSVYLKHMEKARGLRGAAMPPNYKTEPLMYQAVSDRFIGPREPMLFPTDELEIDYEPEITVILDDVPMGVSVEAAKNHVKLVMLLNDFTLRAITRTELPKQFGFVQAKPTSSFSPVAVTLDELPAWDGNTLNLPITNWINDEKQGEANAGVDMFFSYPQLIAHAARTRTLRAGTIIGAGTISNANEESGNACIAEARAHEASEHGEAKTPFLKFGDTIRIDLFDESGATIFGAIENKITKA